MKRLLVPASRMLFYHFGQIHILTKSIGAVDLAPCNTNFQKHSCTQTGCRVYRYLAFPVQRSPQLLNAHSSQLQSPNQNQAGATLKHAELWLTCTKMFKGNMHVHRSFPPTVWFALHKAASAQTYILAKATVFPLVYHDRTQISTEQRYIKFSYVQLALYTNCTPKKHRCHMFQSS